MSRYLKQAFSTLAPYVPGEQPRERKYIKLNTNESPYPPPPRVADAALEAEKTLRLYSDPESHALRAKAAETFGVGMEEILMSNGSDEALNFAFMAFGDDEHPFVFPNHTYGFYAILCRANGIPFQTIPLKADFTVNVQDYLSVKGNIVLANPNAPTGIALKKEEIERILRADESRVVIVDEAYADFSDENCLDLIHDYENLLIVRTFS
ncbi:MAG: aminotransferase class I/II-fold pyridoxal phosphate-dependent enzyme, partial [Clostridia bacterium]|nr:aminotransferase class I/II-fold pyridoxal phosphate-dependent enzyme [Clostridia bacterium]